MDARFGGGVCAGNGRSFRRSLGANGDRKTGSLRNKRVDSEPGLWYLNGVRTRAANAVFALSFRPADRPGAYWTQGAAGVMQPDEIILTAGSKKQKEEELIYLRT